MHGTTAALLALSATARVGGHVHRLHLRGCTRQGAQPAGADRWPLV